MTSAGTPPPRILGLVEGDPRAAMSGIGHFLLQAVSRRLTLAGTIDFAPHGAARVALAAATFGPRRDRWRARFHTSLLAHRVLSATLSRRVRASALDYDLADNPALIRAIHDEVREVAPGLFLGPAMWKSARGPTLVLWFALDTREQSSAIGAAKA